MEQKDQVQTTVCQGEKTDYPIFKSSNYLLKGNPVNIKIASVSLECSVHAHEFIEIAYIISGSGVHCVGERSYRISKGDLFIINNQVPHSFLSDGAEDSELLIYNCLFEPSFIDKSLFQCSDFVDAAYCLFFSQVIQDNPENPGFIKFPKDSSCRFETLLNEIYREFSVREDGYLSIIKAYLTTLIVKAFRIYKKEFATGKFLSSTRIKMVESIIEYINQNFKQTIHLNELAARAFLSPAYFSHIFKDYTNKTLTQFIQAQRISNACSLLRTTDFSIDDIAREVGYRDIKFFYKVFEKAVGTTPGQYRKEPPLLQNTL